MPFQVSPAMLYHWQRPALAFCSDRINNEDTFTQKGHRIDRWMHIFDIGAYAQPYSLLFLSLFCHFSTIKF